MIRPATILDLPWLRKLHKEFCAEFNSQYPTTDNEELDNFVRSVSFSLTNDPSFHIEVAEVDGQLVGYLGAGVMQRAVGKPRAVATPFWLYIMPAHRGHGLGRALAGASVAWLRSTYPQVTTLEIPSRAGDPQWALRGFKAFMVYYHAPLSLADQFITGDYDRPKANGIDHDPAPPPISEAHDE